MNAKDAIEAMTRIDEWRCSPDYRINCGYAGLTKDCRLVMDALLELRAIELRAEQMKLAKDLPDVGGECRDDMFEVDRATNYLRGPSGRFKPESQNEYEVCRLALSAGATYELARFEQTPLQEMIDDEGIGGL